jgi:hypothetical protein
VKSASRISPLTFLYSCIWHLWWQLWWLRYVGCGCSLSHRSLDLRSSARCVKGQSFHFFHLQSLLLRTVSATCDLLLLPAHCYFVLASSFFSRHRPSPTLIGSLLVSYPRTAQNLGLGMPAWICPRAKLDFDPKYRLLISHLCLPQTLRLWQPRRYRGSDILDCSSLKRWD